MKFISYDIANQGGRLYPVSVCLQMVLAYMKDYYQIHELENISGNPYGWFYLNEMICGKSKEIEISPGTELTNSIKVAYKNLGYNFEHCMTDSWDEMVKFIKNKLSQRKPIIYGPIAFQQLKYQISAFRATAIACHYIVIIGCDEDKIYFHDPNGMSYIPLEFEKLKLASTKAVMVPGTKQYSGIIINDRQYVPSKIDIYKSVLAEAMISYKEHKVRTNGYIGLFGIKHFAKDLDNWLGAQTVTEKEFVLRKLGLYFYPKGNQIRSDAITFMQDLGQLVPKASDIVEDFSELFTEACIIYKHGADIITPQMVKFNENSMKNDLAILKKDAYSLYDIESKAYEKLKQLNKIINE